MRIPKVQRTPTSDPEDKTYWEMFSKLCSSQGQGPVSREEEKDVEQRVLALGVELVWWWLQCQYLYLTDDHMVT